MKKNFYFHLRQISVDSGSLPLKIIEKMRGSVPAARSGATRVR